MKTTLLRSLFPLRHPPPAALLVASLTFFIDPGAARSAAAASSGLGLAVQPSSREQSRVFYNQVYGASQGVAMGWTGNYSPGDAGTTARAYRDATILRVNYFRAMAGVPGWISLDEGYSVKAQQAAFMMSVNKALSHSPPPSWLFYTEAGAEAAANSNLSIGRAGPDAVYGQMSDDGGSNFAVGHRRWLLHPPTQRMGTGDVPGLPPTVPNELPPQTANAVWVFDDNTFAPRPTTREEFVAWPPPGFVAYPLVFSRWSFGYPGASFAGTTVTVTRGGTNVPVRLEQGVDGFGDETLVWVLDNADTTRPSKITRPASDTKLQVTLDNVMIRGQARQFRYDVIVFDPETEGPDTRVASVSGPTSVASEIAASYTASGLDLTTQYQWRTGRRSAYTLVEGAESGLANMTATVSSGYVPVATDTKFSGQASFHLVCPDFRDQFLRLNRDLIPGASSVLRFRSMLTAATTSQVAVVQISLDDGVSWRTAYRQAGNQGISEFQFVERTLSLAAYAGRSLRVRLGYLYEGGTAFLDVGQGFGWYVDDLTVTSAEELTAPVLGETAADGTFAVAVTGLGSHALQVRGRVFGNFATEWGSVLSLTAGAAPPAAPRFLAVTRAAGSQLELALATEAGRTYVIEFSTDLKVWTAQRTLTATASQLVWQEPAGVDARRFYRARIGP